MARGGDSRGAMAPRDMSGGEQPIARSISIFARPLSDVFNSAHLRSPIRHGAAVRAAIGFPETTAR